MILCHIFLLIIQEDFLEIHFRNKISIWVDDAVGENGSGQSVITRGSWYNIQMVCSFNRYGNVNGSYRPIDRENREVSIPGLGSFQFFFDFYVDENFQVNECAKKFTFNLPFDLELFSVPVHLSTICISDNRHLKLRHLLRHKSQRRNGGRGFY